MVNRALISGAVAMFATTFASTAHAHSFEHPKVLEIGLHASELVVSVRYDLSPGDESRLVRALFDRNTDGKLDSAEQQKLARYLERAAMLFFELRIQSEPGSLVRQSVSAHRVELPVEATQTMGVSMLYVATLPKVLPGALLEIEIIDRDKDSAKHVPVTVGLSDGWEVAFSSQGELHPVPRQIHRVKLQRGRPLVLRLRHGSRLGARKR